MTDLIETDLTEFLALADKKGVSAYGGDQLARIARLQALLADGMLKKHVTDHHNYIDQADKSGSSKGGFMLQINKRVKASFGMPAPDLPHAGQRVLAMCREAVARGIVAGEDRQDLRADIKQTVYGEIERHGRMYQAYMEAA